MQLGLCVLLTPNVSEDTMELRGLLFTPGPVVTFWSHQNTERQGQRTRIPIPRRENPGVGSALRVGLSGTIELVG